MKPDLATPSDIRSLVDTFYQKVRADDVIGYIFNDVAKVDWVKHLPVMYGFWEQVLFSTGYYKGNPIPKHQQLHATTPLNKDHFKRWVSLFHQTVDELFSGEKAELAKQRAESIATVMQTKIFHGGIGHAGS